MILRYLLAFCCLVSIAADVRKGEFGAAKAGEAPRATAPNTPNAPKPSAEAKRTTYPFHGTLDAVDPASNTVTLRGKQKNRVILVTSKTRVQKNGLRGKLEDGVPGERVSGSVSKNADGKEEAHTVHFGRKP